MAVSKFETAIEVLMRAEGSSGSKRRIIQALDTFYGLSEDQPINPSSQTTVNQFAQRVASDRARVFHGIWSTLNHSLRETGPNIEVFVEPLGELPRRARGLYGDPIGADNLDQFLRFAKEAGTNGQSAGDAKSAAPTP